MSDKIPDYVVLRAGPDLPEGWMPDHLEGRWYDRNKVPFGAPNPDAPDAPPGASKTTAVAEPTGLLEVRDDGAVAEVWHVRPGYR